MKLITAVIRPSRLKKVGNALEAAGLTATEVQGRGAQGGRTEYYRGEAHDVVFRTKVRLEMVVADEQLEDAIDVLVAAARSDDEGTIGDGKVWVTDVVRVVRVRTGETGPEAV